jgi:isopentenyl-diphosphate delta-isomerase
VSSDQSVARRKAEHLALAAQASVEHSTGAGWGDLDLVHDALPEVDLDQVDLRTALPGGLLRAPLVIAGMTGGHEGATEVNAILARAAQRHGLAIGVGSQRAALLDPSLRATYSIVRDHAPDALVIGNIGAAQLIDQGGERPPLGIDDVREAVDMIAADALAVHLNFLEESIQPEGDRRARGCSEAIGALAAELEVPLFAKETGAGMAPHTAVKLRDLGVAALDVGGAGGTSFAVIERMRAERQGDARGIEVGTTLGNWGVPTPVSIAGAATSGLPIIATGGIRSGLDAAKALALGADAVGVARPLLLAALEGDEAVDAWVGRFLSELATVLMLTGCGRPRELRERPLVVTGRTRAWFDDLGIRRR